MAIYWHYACDSIYTSFHLIKTTAGIWLVTQLATGFGYLLKYAAEGVYFVFPGVKNDGVANSFFFDVLLPSHLSQH